MCLYKIWLVPDMNEVKKKRTLVQRYASPLINNAGLMMKIFSRGSMFFLTDSIPKILELYGSRRYAKWGDIIENEKVKRGKEGKKHI